MSLSRATARVGDWLGGAGVREGSPNDQHSAGCGELDGPARTARALALALQLKDPRLVQQATQMLGDPGADVRAVDALLELAEAQWHDCHEDIVFELGHLGDDRAVEVLARWVVELPELIEEDDGNDLHRKAAHALVTIGSPAALAALSRLRSSGGEAGEVVSAVFASRGIVIRE